MIIDFHTHLFPKEIRENRERYLSSDPEFALLYSSPKSPMAGASTLLASMERCGVDRSVVFGFPWKNPDTLKKHNDYILDSVARHRNRLIGFCCVDPFAEQAPREAARCLEAGLAGIGELACYRSGLGSAVLDRLDPLMAIGREKDRPVLIHTNEPIGHRYPGKSSMTLDDIFRLILRYPGNNMVLAHWGGGIFFFQLLKKGVKEHLHNVYFDTAASPFLYDPSVYGVAVRILGVEKILFGSDFPLLPPDRYFSEMTAGGVSAEDTRRICGANAARLLGL